MTGPEIASELRDLVAWFNRQPMSISSVDRLREGVLRAADVLDQPSGAVYGQLHSIRVPDEVPEPRRSVR